MQIESAKLLRSNTAFEVQLTGGKRIVVRWIDLAPHIGDADARRSRFEAVRARDRAVEVTLVGGAVETIDLATLVGPGPQHIDMVVETRGPLVTCDEGGEPRSLATIDGGAVLIGGGVIRWVGALADLPRSGLDISRAHRVDAGERLVTPGLIDCHAHPVFAGNRTGEFAQRARGDSYLDIGKSGGGIVATVAATRQASLDDLIALTCERLSRSLACGTTTMEAKSGYDLTIDGELRMLQAARAADALHAIDLEPTLLGAHALPVERMGDRDGYVADCAGPMIEGAVRGDLCRAIDVYCDQNAFTVEEARRILMAGRDAGLLVRGHVGQFADLGCAQLVAELGGTSVDHVEQISDDGIRALAAHGVVAVMLPGACVQLRMTPPPVDALRRAGVQLAVASDMNPGSSLAETLPVQMWLATTHYGMTVEEAWLGVTRVAARALGRPDIGVLMPGARADLVIWDTDHPADIPYRYDRGATLVSRVIKSGRLVARG